MPRSPQRCSAARSASVSRAGGVAEGLPRETAKRPGSLEEREGTHETVRPWLVSIAPMEVAQGASMSSPCRGARRALNASVCNISLKVADGVGQVEAVHLEADATQVAPEERNSGALTPEGPRSRHLLGMITYAIAATGAVRNLPLCNGRRGRVRSGPRITSPHRDVCLASIG